MKRCATWLLAGLLPLLGAGSPSNVARTAEPGDSKPKAAAAGKDGLEARRPDVVALRKRVDRLIRQLGSDDFEERDKAARLLVEIGLPALMPVRAATADPDTEIAQRANKCAREIERNSRPDFLVQEMGYKTQSDFLRAAKDPNPRIRAAGVGNLFQFKDQGKDLVPVLVKALHDESPLVRRQAARTLGFFGKDEGVVPALIEALKDPDEAQCRQELSVSASAACSLGMIGRIGRGARAAVPAMIEGLKRDDGLPAECGPQDMTMRALGSIAGKDPAAVAEVVPALIDVLRGRRTDLRGLAAFALSLVGPGAKDAVPALLDAFNVKDVADPVEASNIRGNILGALRSNGPGAKAAVPVLIAVLEDEKCDSSEHQNAALVLAAIGPAARDAIPSLTKATKDQDQQVREAAVKALEAIRQQKSSRNPVRLGVEALDGRSVPAASLLWAGPKGGSWSGGNWVDLNTGHAGQVPVAGDSLTFDPNLTAPDGSKGTDTAFVDDITDTKFSITNLTINKGYDQPITLSSSLTTTGNVTIADGKLFSTSQSLNVPNAASTFTWTGGTIGMDVTLGAANAHPTLTISGSDDKTLGKQATFDNFANATWQGTGSIVMTGVANFTNDTGAVFDDQVDGSMTAAPMAAPGFTNKGTFKKSLGGGATTIGPAFTNTGTVEYQSGTVHFTSQFTQSAGMMTLNGGTFTTDLGLVLNGGKLEGIGTFSGDVNNTGGTVHPGLGSAPGNITVTGNYTQGAKGTLVIDFDKTTGDCGRLTVVADPVAKRGGTANLNGTMTVNRNGHMPTTGSYTFLWFGSVNSDFASDNLGTDSWTVNNVTYHFTKQKNAPTYGLNVTK